MRALGWTFAVVLILLFTAWLFRGRFKQWLFPNIIGVQTYQEAKSSHVRIDWTSENDADTVTLYKAGEAIKTDFYAKGYNTFLLYYDNQLVGTFDQFKSTEGLGSQYNFIVWKKQDSLIVDLKINGFDAPL